ncbi:hypothetical protein V1514DRAFT_353675 [Lipomyces japonicus]|uniref:uncharacterized protein n=1 Tax=Lipomyces japonicus TaxID=56871 RepID=UPI0034D0005C
MDPAEEREQELELLQSMYPDELTVISDTEFTILLVPEPPANNDLLPSRHHRQQQAVVVKITYSESYPETVPEIDIELREIINDESDDDDDDDNENDNDNGGKEGDNISAIPVSLEKPNDASKLLSRANDEAQENLGLPSVFAITSAVKDLAEQILQDRQADRERARDEAIRQEEELEQAKFRGTTVTRESFLAWHRAFRAEQQQRQKQDHHNKNAATNAVVGDEQRLTGREIFEKGLQGNKEDDDLPSTDDIKNLSINK